MDIDYNIITITHLKYLKIHLLINLNKSEIKFGQVRNSVIFYYMGKGWTKKMGTTCSHIINLYTFVSVRERGY